MFDKTVLIFNKGFEKYAKFKTSSISKELKFLFLFLSVFIFFEMISIFKLFYIIII